MLEKIFAIFMIIISAQTYYLANNFDLNFIGTSGLGPEVFPKVISIILFVLGIILFITSKNKNEKIYVYNSQHTFSIIFTFGIYIYVLEKLGYLISTILFAFAVMSILKNTSYKTRIIYSIVFTVGLYILFTYLFRVSLPKGIFV